MATKLGHKPCVTAGLACFNPAQRLWCLNTMIIGQNIASLHRQRWRLSVKCYQAGRKTLKKQLNFFGFWQYLGKRQNIWRHGFSQEVSVKRSLWRSLRKYYKFWMAEIYCRYCVKHQSINLHTSNLHFIQNTIVTDLSKYDHVIDAFKKRVKFCR